MSDLFDIAEDEAVDTITAISELALIAEQYGSIRYLRGYHAGLKSGLGAGGDDMRDAIADMLDEIAAITPGARERDTYSHAATIVRELKP